MKFYKYQRRHDGAIEVYNDEFIKLIPTFKTDFMLLYECDKHGNRLEEEKTYAKVIEPLQTNDPQPTIPIDDPEPQVKKTTKEYRDWKARQVTK